MKATTLGIDLAKSTFRLHGVDARGAVVLRRQLTRKQLLPFLARLSPCLIGMEACAGAHHWAREDREARPRREVDEPAFRHALSQKPKEPQQRRGRDL
jgi:transposase